ncbi:MAG TPA: NUDIX domain-containing protein [Chitinophagaceae bacterium]|nr:NUDIX domain-containing protein [Chitinophagaceae bacterium]
MPKQSAGILLYRIRNKTLELFLVHPGGPFFAKKDHGAWSIPKGEFENDEEPLAAATREFKEETGMELSGEFIQLGSIKQKSGKIVYAWAVEGDIDPEKIKSNSFEIEWPPKSGKMKRFPEIDKAAWLNLNEAIVKINSGQLALIKELEDKLENI